MQPPFHQQLKHLILEQIDQTKDLDLLDLIYQLLVFENSK